MCRILMLLSAAVCACSGCQNGSSPTETPVAKAPVLKDTVLFGFLPLQAGSNRIYTLRAHGDSAWFVSTNPNVAAVISAAGGFKADSIGFLRADNPGRALVCEWPSVSDHSVRGCWDVLVTK